MTNVLGAILAVFAGVGDWIVETVNAMTPLFYDADAGLTFMGTLAVAGLAFSVVFLIIGVISNFLKFRG